MNLCEQYWLAKYGHAAVATHPLPRRATVVFGGSEFRRNTRRCDDEASEYSVLSSESSDSTLEERERLGVLQPHVFCAVADGSMSS